ncbi:MAG: aminomethyl transferase family protein [Thermodesulfobacteriota bacterium]|jgi:vanillate/3-O-methylgallate O-demethylase
MNEISKNLATPQIDLVQMLRNAPSSYHPGWGRPEYTNWMDEQMSWKKTCYIGDWSFLTELMVKGPDALKLLSYLSVNDFTNFEIGQGKHLIQCNEDGKVIAEGIVMRLAEEEFCVQSPPPALWTAYNVEKGGCNAKAEFVDWFNFQVQGPNSLYVLEKATGESLRDIRFMRFRKAPIRGRDVIVLRQGMAGEIGYELQGPREYAQDIYDAILEGGQELGIRRLGRRTAMINHLEACFPTGNWHYLMAWFTEEMTKFSEYVVKFLKGASLTPKLRGSFVSDDIRDYYRSPVEMGWTKNIKFNHDFIGRKALEAEVTHPKRTIVTLEWNSEDVIEIFASLFRDGEPYEFMDMPHQEQWICWADQVMKDGKLVGVSTVPGYSFYFRKILSLTYIDVAWSKPGTEVVIVWGNPGTPQKHIRATVAPAPYKKDNRRIDVTKLPSYLK